MKLTLTQCAIAFAISLVSAGAAAQDEASSSGARAVQSDQDGAQSEPTAAELTDRAEQHFTAGEYDAAVALLKRVYEIEKDSITLYNIAHVLEAKGDLEGAREHYQEFAMISDVSLEYREEAARRAKILRDVIESRAEDEEPDTTDRTAPGPSEGTLDDEMAVAPRSTRWRPVGWVMTGVGLSGVTVGLLSGFLALEAEKDFEAATTLGEARSHASKMRTLAAVADTFFITGSVLAITGATIALTTYGPAGNDSGVVLLRVGRESVGASWRFEF